MFISLFSYGSWILKSIKWTYMCWKNPFFSKYFDTMRFAYMHIFKQWEL